MSFYDVFNGDADGLCALHQLRLAAPRDSVLITGVKRENALLSRVTPQRDDQITVVDVALDRNRAALDAALVAGAAVQWFDHHLSGAAPVHPRLEAHIDCAPDVCTGLLVDRYLAGRFRAWGVVAAFGDNLVAVAETAATPLGLERHRVAQLRELGECLNYNAYGETVADLHYEPVDLYAALRPYADPLDFVASEPVLDILRTGRDDDLDRAQRITPSHMNTHAALYMLPATAWARRVSGVFANRLVRADPQRAHGVLTERPEGSYTVSIRSPLLDQRGAGDVCAAFGGGGRASAGGIDALPATEIDRLAAKLAEHYTRA